LRQLLGEVHHLYAGAHAWSSTGAKLQRSEVECPICATSYERNCMLRRSTVTRCCFQSLCVECYARLSDRKGKSGFACPFCRIVSEPPEELAPSRLTDERGTSLAGILRILQETGMSPALREARRSARTNWADSRVCLREHLTRISERRRVAGMSH
jgi:hypothetical protein